MHRRFRSAVPVGLLALLLAVPACGDDGDEASATTTTDASGDASTSTSVTSTEPSSTPPSSTPPSSTGTSGPEMTLPGADTEPKTGDAEGRGALVAVRTGGHDGFDRVTFEFEGLRPGYQVEYVDPPITQDASGDVVEVQGNALLQVRFEPASGFDIESGKETYTGPDVVQGNGTTNVQEVVATGDFEAVMHWVIGLDTEAGFTVTTLGSPARIVVDVEDVERT